MININTRHIPLELIKPLLPENPIILEAGSHIGRGTLQLSKTWPKGTIHAFEPITILFERLQQKTAKQTNIKYYKEALSATTGIAVIYESSGRCTSVSSLLKPSQFTQEYPEVFFKPTQVTTITLDDWAKREHIDHIDLLVLDLQGAELMAMQAGNTILQNTMVIHTEVNLIERYEHTPLYAEIRDWLATQGFELYAQAFKEQEMWGNALFIKK